VRFDSRRIAGVPRQEPAMGSVTHCTQNANDGQHTQAAMLSNQPYWGRCCARHATECIWPKGMMSIAESKHCWVLQGQVKGTHLTDAVGYTHEGVPH